MVDIFHGALTIARIPTNAGLRLCKSLYIRDAREKFTIHRETYHAKKSRNANVAA